MKVEETRQVELNDYLTLMHIYCIIILLSGLTLSLNIPKLINFPSLNMLLFFSIGLGACIMISHYNKAPNMQKKFAGNVNWIHIIYISFPMVIAVTAIFIMGQKVPYMETILILPVLISASILGKKAGIFMAWVCALLLVFQVVAENSTSVVQIIESNLILISIIFVVGWFVGGIMSIEAGHRKLLEKSLLSLKEEICVRKKIEEELCKLTRAVELSPSIIIITDHEGNIEYVNNKFKHITGFSSQDVIKKNMGDLVVDLKNEYIQAWEALKTGKEWNGELYSKTKSGDFYWEFVSILPFRSNEGVITNFLKVSEDITKRKTMENEIARLDKLNLVGEMAAGIGHEIRNPMTTVRGFLQLLASKEECARFKEYYDLMIDELDRANSIITEFLSLAKNKTVKLSLNNLNTIIGALFPLIQADTFKRNSDVKLEMMDLPDLPLDEGEIRQLILNLVRNALEAMPSGGNLTIRTFTDKNKVVLEIRDEGQGIAPDILEKIGTPFFTTKDNGTGLGLAVCFSIAARHNAKIAIETGSNGTTFLVKFKQLKNSNVT